MDTISYSRHLANSIEEIIKQSDMTKQQVADKAGIAWATFSRRLAHPETSYFTVPEIISVCTSLKLDFIAILKNVEETESQFPNPALAEGQEP